MIPLSSIVWAGHCSVRVRLSLRWIFCRRAYAQAPENAEIAAHLGEALWVLERKTEAQAIWQEALDAFPDDKTLKETLERLLP
jgi:hypothetical protein